jgi:hypothetical protein
LRLYFGQLLTPLPIPGAAFFVSPYQKEFSMSFNSAFLQPFSLKSTLADGREVDPQDVIKTKQALLRSGHYQMPSYGLTSLPDGALFDGLKRFQRRNGLMADGIAKPKGPTAKKIKEQTSGLLTFKEKVIPVSAEPTSRTNTPWWRSKSLPEISGSDFSANGRAVDTLLKQRGNGDHGIWIAEDISNGDTTSIGILGDRLQQLHKRDPIRAEAYLDDTISRLSETAKHKVMSFADETLDDAMGYVEDIGEGLGKAADWTEDKADKVSDVVKATYINATGTDNEVLKFFNEATKKFRKKGYTEATNNLDRFLNGNGAPKKVSREEALKEKFYQEAEKKNKHITESTIFTGKSKRNTSLNQKLKNLADGKSFSTEHYVSEVQGLADTYGQGLLGELTGDTSKTDDVLEKGRKQLKSTTKFTAARRGDTIYITGVTTHNGNQKYDFESGGLGQIMGAKRLQDRGIGKPFRIIRQWKDRVQGTVKINAKGGLSNPQFTWKNKNEADKH